MKVVPISESLRRVVERQPGKTALITPAGSYTFAALYDRALRFAAALTGLGVARGDRVTLYAANCAEWVVTYYGSLMAGAVINPINMMLTPEEVEHVVRDCGARVVVGSAAGLKPIEALKTGGVVRELICTGAEAVAGLLPFSEMLARKATDFTPHVADPGELCSIGYTSGTTGYPKGAMHSHRAVAMNAQLTALMHGKSASDVVVTALPLAHVYGTVVLNGTLATGGTLVVHPRFEEAAILHDIGSYRATVFEGVPTMYFFLLNHADLERTDLRSLRICTVGGQTMPVAKMEEVERRFGCSLVELWGMTELAGLGTTFAHTGPVRHGSIGVALPYCQAKVVDLEDPSKALPAGEAGELMFRGPLVMQGYYGNEKATHETIEPDGWLHTGDVARIDDEGFVFVVDRKKDLILTAGYNIYPAEIERIVAAHPDVAMVAVGPIPDEARGELAKAYIVPRAGARPSEESIIEHCRKHLAAYKVPRAVQFVADLPKTSSGKIMRRKLAELG